ncbi:MAG: hypothetical protein LUE06_10300 [Oscillospiraceae bacterium]|nr:hypothetical protein [Oscillospiraceae bacterium]
MVGNNVATNYASGTVANCYYLDTTANAAYGTNSSTIGDDVLSKTADEFASGEVTWLLQNANTDYVWGQSITGSTTDAYPILISDEDSEADKKVVRIAFYKVSDGTAAETAFAYGYTNVNKTLASYPDDEVYTFYASNDLTGQIDTATEAFGADRTLYALAAADYTLRAAVTDSGPFNPGDTVTVDVYLTAQTDGTVTAAQFAFAGDWYTVTNAAGLSADDSVAFSSTTQTVSITYHDEISVSTAETKIATVMLTVNADAAASSAAAIAFDLTGSYINEGEITPDSATAPTVTVYNLTLTLTTDETSSFTGEPVTAYLRYNETGVYSDAARKTKLTALPSATAASGYELKTGYWTLDDGTQVSEADILNNTAWTASATAVPTTLKQYTVTITIPDSQYGTIAYKGTTLTQNTEITVNEETTYGDIISRLAFTTVTDTAYQVRAWKIGDDDVVSTDAVSADVTLTPQIAASEFALTLANSDGYTIAVSSGASGDSAPYTVTYGTDVMLTLTPAEGYAIYSASCSVGDGTPVTLAADDNGDFTIPGGKIVGDVVLDVTAKAYHKITFEADTGSSMTTGIYYAWDGIAGLYSAYSALGLSGAVTDTATITGSLSADTSNAANGSRYRLAVDEGNEPLWSDDSSNYFTAAILENVVFGKDTAFTPIAIPQYLVTFANGADGFDGYAEGAVLTEWVDENGTVSAVPTVNAAAHYEFSYWLVEGTTNSKWESLASFTISEPVTITPVFAKINYSVTFINGGVGAFQNITGVSGTEGAYTAQYDESDISFTFTPDGNYSVTAIKYQAGSADAVTLTASSGVYTIPKESVTGNISVTVETDAIRTYTFVIAADDVEKGTISSIYTVVTKVDEAPDLTGISVAVTPGYEFVGWTLDGGTTVVSAADIENETVTAATENRTYTAVFRLADLSVIYDSSLISVSGLVDGCAHLGTNLVITPTDGLAVLSVTYTIGGGEAQTATTNTGGTYTIPGTALTDTVVITVNVVKDSAGNTVRFAFITRNEYFGENVWDTETRKIALLATGEMNGVYRLTDGTEFYYSERYGAYVKWVDAGETAATLSVQLSYDASGTPTAITYDGDINGTGIVTAGDAGIINDILKNRYTGTLSDLQLFMLDTDDVTETDNSYKKVFTSDVVWVLKESVK